jgi:hypothetical protein
LKDSSLRNYFTSRTRDYLTIARKIKEFIGKIARFSFLIKNADDSALAAFEAKKPSLHELKE